MESLKFESNAGKQTMLSLGCAGFGLVLTIGFRHFEGPGMTNSLAGFLLGLLLLLIGISAFLLSGKQTIVVEPKGRRILIEETNRFRTKNRSIAFSDIVNTSIGYAGKKSSYVTFYYLVLKLRDGKEYPLFAPGYFFEGGSDRSVMESRRRQLEELIKG